MAEIRIPFAQNPLAVTQAPLGAAPPRIGANDGLGVAAAVGDAARQIGALVEAERRAQGAAAQTRGNALYTRRLGELEVEFQGRDLRDSGEAATEFRRRATEIAAEVGESIPFPDARRAWMANAETILAPREVNVRRDAFERGRQARLADLTSANETHANAAALARNPVERETALALGRQAITAAVAAGDLNPAQARQMEDRFNTSVSTARVVQMMTTNPGAALAALQDPAQTPGLDADRRASLIMQAQNRQQSMAAQAEAQLARRERAVGMELQQVNGLLSAGIVPEDRIAAIQQRARGTAFERVLPGLIEDARQVGRFAVMPLEQQMTELRAVQARVQGGTATDVDLAQQQRLTGIITAQQRDLDQNGVGGSVGRRIFPDLPALDFTNPESVNQRVAAAQELAQRYGRPVSALTADETRNLVRQFTEGPPESRLRVVQSISQISDPNTRAATIRALETARGDTGRMPPGTLALIADMAGRGGDGQRRALQALTDLTADVSDRVRAPAERATLNSALESAAGSGYLRVLREQFLATGDARFAAASSAELDRIKHLAEVRMSAGMDPDTAVRQAVSLLRGHRTTLEDGGRAMISWPVDAGLSAPDARRGLDALRRDALAAVTVPGGEAGAGDNARRLQTAIRQGVWINEGNRFALVYRSGDGSSAVVAETTLDGIQRAARGVVQREQAPPPPAAVGTGQAPPAMPRTPEQGRAERAREIIQRRQEERRTNAPPALQ
jgi:hypothetical protein